MDTYTKIQTELADIKKERTELKKKIADEKALIRQEVK